MVKKKVAQVEKLEAKLVREIRYGKAGSRLELATALRLAPSTVGIYVDRLIEQGFLLEGVSGGIPRRGRPALQLQLNGNAGCFIGVEFECRILHAVSVDFSGVILKRYSVCILDGTTTQQVLDGLLQAIREVMPPMELLGIGVAVPGTVDAVKGIAKDYQYVEGWSDIPLADFLTRCFGVPAYVENNARATALGCLVFDKGKRSTSFVSLLVRSTVGAGIVINGELLQGAKSLAGDVGKIQMGNLGLSVLAERESVEEVSAASAITRYVIERLHAGAPSLLSDQRGAIKINMVIDAANEGDALAREALQRAARGLGWLAHLLTLVVNPEVILISGALNGLGDWLRLEVQAALNDFASAIRIERPRIALSHLSEEVGALGAASLALDCWKPHHTHQSKALVGSADGFKPEFQI